MTDTDLKTVLAGIDASEHSGDALALALVLAPLLDAERIMTLVPERSPATGLQEAARRRNAILVTIGASRPSGLGRVLPGTAERLLSGSPCPVAVAPPDYARGPRRIDTIGVAFDGSAESMNALAWAKALALSGGSRLRLVSVHEPLAAAMPAFHGLPLAVANTAAEDWLARQLAAAERDARREGVDVESVMLRGRPAALLKQQSRELDLLVTGSRGSLVRNAAGPVVVVPRGYRSTPPAVREDPSALLASVVHPC